VPRDSTATKERILREAGRLFARRGLWQPTVREITAAAGQRNVSALNYHFGSRDGLLAAILEHHGGPTDEARRVHLDAVGRDASSRDLVAALVIPYAAHLGTPDGRDYLRIVAQLSGRFAAGWRSPNPGVGPWLQEILSILEDRQGDLPIALRQERIVEMIMLMTVAIAERARVVDSAGAPALDELTFIENLTDVLLGILDAPLRGPLSAHAASGRVGGGPALRPVIGVRKLV
jgi:TetR/AcrR family transcriptional regulator, regulator of cefoperazone and chloramphenicol sensitivity